MEDWKDEVENLGYPEGEDAKEKQKYLVIIQTHGNQLGAISDMQKKSKTRCRYYFKAKCQTCL